MGLDKKTEAIYKICRAMDRISKNDGQTEGLKHERPMLIGELEAAKKEALEMGVTASEIKQVYGKRI